MVDLRWVAGRIGHAVVGGVLLLVAARVDAGELERDVGRSETRVWSAPYRLALGSELVAAGIPERLERLGYERVRGRRPDRPGQYFWGHERFWIFRRGFQYGGDDYAPRLFGLGVSGSPVRLRSFLDEAGDPLSGVEAPEWGVLEPQLLAESLRPDRAARHPVSLDSLPEHVWRAVLAIEDRRFFDHVGVDGRSVARALLANLKRGRISEGGSTITQQLIKMRELTAKRTVGRKVSEAVRAVSLEAEHDKEEILEAYLNHVFMGHLGAVNIYGMEAGARAWFGKSARELDLGEAATLAAMVQGPNAMHPDRPTDRLVNRQRQVLAAMEEEGWASAAAVARERRRGLPRAQVRRPEAAGPRYLLDWLAERGEQRAPSRADAGRGLVFETTVDPWLQEKAEAAVTRGLKSVRQANASVVVMEAETGRVLAWVGGRPGSGGDSYDRARKSKRQPGSTVKPLVLLEAFERCGRQKPVYPARRVSDRAVTIELEPKPWSPRNPDGRHRGFVTLREATERSLNVPFVRLARWCSFDAVADRFERAGLQLPRPVPPAFVLGAVEVTPVDLARAYGALAGGGVRREPHAIRGLVLPGGRRVGGEVRDSERVARATTAWMVTEVLREPARRLLGGDGMSGRAFAKTGTSSNGRDAWVVGGVGNIVIVAWIGADDGRGSGIGGASTAGPIWAEVARRVDATRDLVAPARPPRVVVRSIEPESGLLVGNDRRGSRQEYFRRGYLPPRKRWFRNNRPPTPIE